MGRYLLLACLAWLALPASGAAMDLEGMMTLPGADLITLRANEVVERLGPPAAIRDHGAKDLPRHSVKMGDQEASLSDDPWNLIYGKYPDRDMFEWVNRRPGTPAELQGLDTLVVYTHPDKDILDLDAKTGKLLVRRAQGKLEEHAIYGVASIPRKGIPWEEFTRQWGPPDEETIDEKMQPVSRYWVSLKVQEVPVALFAVDALRGPRGDVLSVAIYNSRAGFVADRLREMWEEEGQGKGGQGPEGGPDQELAPPEGNRPEQINVAPHGEA